MDPAWAAAQPAPADVRDRLGVPERYLLFTGNLEPRKNLPRLLAAFGWDALFATEYTGELMKAIRPIADPARGWPEGIYEQDGAVNGSITANTNSTVLSAEAFRRFGPLMQAPR